MESCNVTHRLDEMERLLFESGFEVMDIAAQILVNFSSSLTKSHKIIFSAFTLFVTSISPLQVEFLTKAMLGEREKLYILAQEILGNKACTYVSDFEYKC